VDVILLCKDCVVCNCACQLKVAVGDCFLGVGLADQHVLERLGEWCPPQDGLQGASGQRDKLYSSHTGTGSIACAHTLNLVRYDFGNSGGPAL
jgi:hypothetical protein